VKTLLLKRLEAYGFKSFADKLEVEFDYCEPHTCDFNHELGKQNSQRI